MESQRFRGLGPVAFGLFASATANLFFPSAIGFVITFAALLIVAGVAIAADRFAESAGASR